MIDEDKNQRYKNIIYRLRIINRKIEDLKKNISDLEYETKRSMVIDNQLLNYDKIQLSTNNLNNVSGSISGYIIPSINRKINN